MIVRELTRLLRKAVKDIPVVTLTGPRQSGKTTLVQGTLRGYRYVNLEFLDNRARALADPRGFLEDLGDKVVIDEVHHVPELFPYIQGRVDQRKKNGLYVLTGSQNFQLLAKVTQSLAGRTYIYELLPLSARELNAAGKLPAELEEWLVKGCYPRLYDKQRQTEMWKRAYLRTYVERDLRQVINVKDLTLFNRFLALCAGRVGQLLNYSALANEIGVDMKTAQQWLSVLETSYIVFRLPPHHRNFNKRVVKTPKLYFHDTGLACSLLGIRNANELRSHYARGPLFENMVVAEVMKQRINQGLEPAMYFWRDNIGNEVDLLIDDPHDQRVIEIKSSYTANPSALKGLRYHKALNEAKALYQLVYAGDDRWSSDNIRVIGWREMLGAARVKK